MIVLSKCEIEHTNPDGKTATFKKGTPFRVIDRNRFIVEIVDAHDHKIWYPADKFDDAFECPMMAKAGA